MNALLILSFHARGAGVGDLRGDRAGLLVDVVGQRGLGEGTRRDAEQVGLKLRGMMIAA